MIRKLFLKIVLRHNRRSERRPGEIGIDYLRRHMAGVNKRNLRRFRREEGKFPWWFGLRRIWRWLYAPYHAHLRAEDEKFLKGLSVVEYTREMLRRQSFERKIMPVCPIPKSLLDTVIPGVDYKSLHLDGMDVADLPYVELPQRKNFRLHYSVYPPNPLDTMITRTGFKFCCVEWCSSSIGGDQWDDCTVEVVFHGEAHWDGVRHLWWGHEQTGNKGYLYCTKPSDLAEMLYAVDRLETQHCREKT
jgi:hypothetical protein